MKQYIQQLLKPKNISIDDIKTAVSTVSDPQYQQCQKTGTNDTYLVNNFKYKEPDVNDNTVSKLVETWQVHSALRRKFFSGRFILRITPKLHKILKIAAAEQNTSLNKIATDFIKTGLAVKNHIKNKTN
jgi:hypothetical protein